MPKYYVTKVNLLRNSENVQNAGFPQLGLYTPSPPLCLMRRSVSTMPKTSLLPWCIFLSIYIVVLRFAGHSLHNVTCLKFIVYSLTRIVKLDFIRPISHGVTYSKFIQSLLLHMLKVHWLNTVGKRINLCIIGKAVGVKERFITADIIGCDRPKSSVFPLLHPVPGPLKNSLMPSPGSS